MDQDKAKVSFGDWLKRSSSLFGARFLRQSVLNKFFRLCQKKSVLPVGMNRTKPYQQKKTQEVPETKLPVENDP